MAVAVAASADYSGLANASSCASTAASRMFCIRESPAERRRAFVQEEAPRSSASVHHLCERECIEGFPHVRGASGPNL